jgi:hypothetical protein
LLVISVVSSALLLASANGIYKKWPYNYLESFSYVQLIVFAAGMAYARYIDGNVTAVAETSFGLALAVFLLVIGYHICSRMKYFHDRFKGDQEEPPSYYERINSE